MALSGHKDIKMLQRYTHTHQDSKKLAVEKLKDKINIESIDTYIDTLADLDNVASIDKDTVIN